MKYVVSTLAIVFAINTALAANTPDASPSPAPTNAIIDLTVPGPQQSQTDAGLFDESVNFAPDFAINQNDPALSSLFSPTGVSSLCVPSSISEALIYLLGYHDPTFSYLTLDGLSDDGTSIDPNAVVRQMAGLCKTDPTNGTNPANVLPCINDVLQQSGYSLGQTQFITPFNSDPTLPMVTRTPTIQDIRTSLKSGYPVLLAIGWFAYDATTKQWTRKGAHHVSAYGYDWNNSWGENEILVKIVNPEIDYGTSRSAATVSTVTLQRYSPQPGVTYPTNRPFMFSGQGFGGLTTRGFLESILTIAPGN